MVNKNNFFTRNLKYCKIVFDLGGVIMGRAYEVRKASIQKTGAARGKIYTMYAKEIYQAAKNGGTEVTSNATLKRLLVHLNMYQDLKDRK